MRYSNQPARLAGLSEEKKLWKRGYGTVACLDEVGRGPLAGPVVAAAVALLPISKSQFLISNRFPKLKDSKKLNSKQREYFSKILTAHPAIRWGIGRVYPTTIDRINIFNATKLAMKRALRNLEDKLQQSYLFDGRQKHNTIEFLILDGNTKLNVPIPQQAIVKADEKVFSCAAASIIAKVKRDRSMKRYHRKYPRYGFDRNKGYGTKEHIEAIKKHGPSPIHRKSFVLH